MATYYISTTGSNSTGNGSSVNPWATLSYAISNVTTFGDIIHVNAGTYPAVSTQMLLPNGVSIEGAGRTVTTIPLTYNGGNPCIKLETWNGWANKSTVGHQHISGIKFTGSTTPGTPIGIVGIETFYRNYVEIYDCEFTDFVRTAVAFNGEQPWNGFNIDNPYYAASNSDFFYLPFEDSFVVGNKFYNNIVHNSCGRITPGINDFSGALEVSTNDGVLVYGNYMTATGRSGTDNGVPIKFIGDAGGFNRNSKIYDNTIISGHFDTNYWQFAIEIWWDLGGTEVYDNTLQGCIDFCDSWDQYGAGYGMKIYNNDIGYSTNTTNLDRGIHFEGTHVDSYVYNNHIHYVARGMTVNNENSSLATVWDNVHIYNNIVHHLSGLSWQTWGFLFDYSIVEQGGLWQNIYIQHNIFHASSTAPDPTAFGIMLPTADDFDSIYIENNILINWERGAIYGDKARDQATNIFIRNNLIYDSYNSNDPYFTGTFPTAGITYSGTVKQDPLFVSSSDFHLQSSSPAIGAGRPTSVTNDYDDNLYDTTTPSIGAYEYTSTVTGNTYYVKNGGNDAADGLTDATAWETIAKVNGYTFSAGDNIYFKRGDTWREEVSLVPKSGSSSGYILIGAYGTGEKPKILGSTLENSTSDWTLYSGNVWQNTDASFSVNVGNLIFNNDNSYGVYKTTLGAVTNQGDYFFNVSTNTLYLYSTINPGTYYSNIECALDRHIINFGYSKSYVILENLDIRYGGGHGVSGYNGCSYITIKDCDFSFIGGGYFEDGAARYGNAIQFWQSSSYITVERCKFDNIYDAAITPQYSGSGSDNCNINNWHVRNNLINRSEYSWEFFTSGCVGTLSDIYFQNNTCRNAGGGFGHNQRPDSQNGRHVMIWSVSGTAINNIWIRNNIFDIATESAIHIWTSSEAYINFDYNLYNVNTVAYNGSTYNTLASWQTHRSDENNSISGDPRLISSTNWHLTVESPGIGEGLNVGYITDYDLVAWNNPPSIGAYEYVEETEDILIENATHSHFSII